MGKKKHGLGRSLIKDRFGGPKKAKGTDSFLHTSELDDGYEWGRLNLQSVTEQSHLDEFLATAELAGTEFTAEKLNIAFVNPEVGSDLLSAEEMKNVLKLHQEHKELLSIPRRPKWDASTTPEELDRMERESFLDWRRQLAELQDVKGLILTPYERNLDFWRQLWRVIERSDIVVQIVDARNPLLFRCEDLEKYVKEVNPGKVNLVLVNKADLLTQKQRDLWGRYFSKIGVKVAFWSAIEETERLKSENEQSDKLSEMESEDNESSDEESDVDVMHEEELHTVNKTEIKDNRLEEKEISSHVIHESDTTDCLNDRNSETEANAVSQNISAMSFGNCVADETENKTPSCEADIEGIKTGEDLTFVTKLLTGEELLSFFKSLHNGKKVQEDVISVGMVGYPNVGKSSTINAILQSKKVPVSANPGRTKHFQTLFVDSTMMLCDCPGLVMPTFVATKAEMILNGILPIDQMRDHTPPVNLLCQHIPRETLETMYGINIPKPPEGDDPSRPPTASEVLNAYGYMRGYMTSNGVPDCPRSSRYVLKDYVKGKLLYCISPPGLDEEEFESTTTIISSKAMHKHGHTDILCDASDDSVPVTSHIDKDFFSTNESQVHSKGVKGVAGFSRVDAYTQHRSQGSEAGSIHGSMQSVTGKPWKKHGNQNKKEKIRRLHKDFDY